MNKQEFQKTIRNMEPPKHFSALTFKEAFNGGFNSAKNNALFNSCFLNEPEKPVLPQFVADWIEWCKRNSVTLLGGIRSIDEFGLAICNDKKVKSLDASKWATQNQETFAKAWLFGYEVKKEKLYRAKNRHTGEYLCYCFKFFHDKNSSSENQRFTAEEKRWKELGYWGNDLYVFEEAEGEDE